MAVLYEHYDPVKGTAHYSTSPTPSGITRRLQSDHIEINPLGVVSTSFQPGTMQILHYHRYDSGKGSRDTYVLKDPGGIGRLANRLNAWVWTTTTPSQGRIPVHVVAAADYFHMRYFVTRDEARAWLNELKSRGKVKPGISYGAFHVLPLSALEGQ